MGLIILPQALKLVIPGIVNTFISLFKDTTLVTIIGLFDMLGMIQSALSIPTGSVMRSRALPLPHHLLGILLRDVALQHGAGEKVAQQGTSGELSAT